MMNIQKEKLRDRMIGAAFVLITLIFLLLVSVQVTAQPQLHHHEETIKPSKNILIGLRNGYLSGFTVECEDEKYSLENIILINKYNFNQTILYKRITKHSKIEGLKAFAGVGIHYYHSKENFEDTKEYNNLIGYDIFGLDFVMGFSYKIPKFPLSFSFDLKPTTELFATNLTNYCYYYCDYGAITIKYTL